MLATRFAPGSFNHRSRDGRFRENQGTNLTSETTGKSKQKTEITKLKTPKILTQRFIFLLTLFLYNTSACSHWMSGGYGERL